MFVRDCTRFVLSYLIPLNDGEQLLVLIARSKSIPPTSLQRQNYIIYYQEQNYNMPIGSSLLPLPPSVLRDQPF